MRRWREQFPGRRWVYNATGGLKLMFGGVLDEVGTAQVRVVYRELGDQWFELDRGADGIVSRPLDGFNANDTDRIAISDIVETCWPRQSERVEFTPLPAVDWPLAEVVRQGFACDWDWPFALNEAGVPLDPSVRGGKPFELFVAAVLHALGVTNLIWSVRRVRGKQELNEIDLVANRGGRLLTFDCKLRDEVDEEANKVGPITSQIRLAFESQRSLGGLSAKSLLLRPNRLLSAEERALAGSYGLTVLDLYGGWSLFELIAKFVGIRELPEPLAEAQTVLTAARGALGSRPFARECPAVRTVFPDRGSRAVADLSECMRAMGQDWIVYRLDGQLHVRCSAIPRQVIETIFAEFGATVEGYQSPGTSCKFRLKVPKLGRADFERFLESRVGRTLVDADG